MNVILQHKKIINNNIHYGGHFGGGYAVLCTLDAGSLKTHLMRQNLMQ